MLVNNALLDRSENGITLPNVVIFFGKAFVKPQKYLGLHPRNFLGFTQVQTFPVGYNGSYYMFGRDITVTT